MTVSAVPCPVIRRVGSESGYLSVARRPVLARRVAGKRAVWRRPFLLAVAAHVAIAAVLLSVRLPELASPPVLLEGGTRLQCVILTGDGWPAGGASGGDGVPVASATTLTLTVPDSMRGSTAAAGPVFAATLPVIAAQPAVTLFDADYRVLSDLPEPALLAASEGDRADGEVLVGAVAGAGAGHGRGFGTGDGTGSGTGNGTGTGTGTGGHGVRFNTHGNARPPYPAVARQNGWQGVTRVRVLVGTDGAVAALEVARSSGFAVLDEAAVTAARRWRFVAARAAGRAVAAWIEIPIQFELRDGDRRG